MEEKKIDVLYKLLERAKAEHDEESISALRWAIFTLERLSDEQEDKFSMLLNWFGSYLQKKLEQKKRTVIRLRWQKAELERLLKELEARKNEQIYREVAK